MLTKMQKKVLFELSTYIEANEVAPTVRELCSKVGLKTVSTMHVHLSKLEAKGYIERVAKSPRNIKILKTGDNIFDRNNNMIISSGRTIINDGNKINSCLKFRIYKKDYKLCGSINIGNKNVDIYEYDYIDIIYNQFTGITTLELHRLQSDESSAIFNVITDWTRSTYFNVLSKIVA